jgi:hypothetical protein
VAGAADTAFQGWVVGSHARTGQAVPEPESRGPHARLHRYTDDRRVGAKLMLQVGCGLSLKRLFGEVVSGYYYGPDGLRSPLTMPPRYARVMKDKASPDLKVKQVTTFTSSHFKIPRGPTRVLPSFVEGPADSASLSTVRML